MGRSWQYGKVKHNDTNRQYSSNSDPMSFASANVGKIIYNKVNSTVAVYPQYPPQATAAPYCVYVILRSDPSDTKDGAAWSDFITVLIHVYDTSYANCAAKSISIRGLLDHLSGTIESVVLKSCIFVTESDDFDDDLQLNIKTMEFRFWISN